MEALPLFDPVASLRPGSTCIIIGHQNAGKTTLAYNLLQHVSGENGLVVSYETMPLYPRLRTRVRHWADELSPDLLGTFLAEHPPTDESPPSFALLDGCIYDSTILRNPTFRSLFEQSRTRQNTVILTMLYAMGLPPTVRAAVDWVFIFRVNIVSNVQRLYDTWLTNSTYTFEQFRTLVAGDSLSFYTCLVLNTQTGQLFRHTVVPLTRLTPSVDTIASLAALPPFQPAQIHPGDYCVALGSYSRCHANLLCSLVPSDLSGGFLLREAKEYPRPRSAYATIQDRVRTDVSGSHPPEKVALRLAHHLLALDLSGTTPSFALLDSWFPADQVPFQFLYAHRRQQQILLLSSQWGYKSLGHHPPPDYLFCATILDGLRELCPASIPYNTFFDMMLALGSDRYLVLCQRTGGVMIYTPPPVTVTYR